jgi:outer membrane protein
MVVFSHLGVSRLKKSFVALTVLVVGMAGLGRAQAQAPNKVAIIAVQQAILATKDGQKAVQDMQARFNPKRAELEKKEAALGNLQDQLKKGGATMSDAAKEKMAKDINTLNTELTRGKEDFDADVQQEEQKIMNELGGKIMDVITKYATQNGYSVVIDVSSQTTPVLWADPSANITEHIVKLYDQAHPGTATSGAPAPAAAKPATAAPKPAAPTGTKK